LSFAGPPKSSTAFIITVVLSSIPILFLPVSIVAFILTGINSSTLKFVHPILFSCPGSLTSALYLPVRAVSGISTSIPTLPNRSGISPYASNFLPSGLVISIITGKLSAISIPFSLTIACRCTFSPGLYAPLSVKTKASYPSDT